MKLLTKLSFMLVLMSAVLLVSCAKEEVNPKEENPKEDPLKSVVALIKANENFSTFYKVIQITGMESMLEEDKAYTVFAPDNDAWNVFMTKQGWSSIEDANKSTLELIMKFHISEKGKIESKDFKNGLGIEIMFNQKKVTLLMEDNGTAKVVLGLTNATITQKDIDAKNGIIHKIDHILSL
ncbi:MAG TPA: fasciclin domain-containing protein [Saprospiraceae bacterium]|nr:fasciclin domain-containing protein [Saprospiraceae bacterium]